MRTSQLVNYKVLKNNKVEKCAYSLESVLNSSILIFTNLSNLEIDQLWANTDNLFLDSINFNKDCWVRLNNSFIYQEDHFEFILSLSINTFINIFNSDLLFNTAIFSILEKISSLVKRSISIESKNKASNKGIIKDFDFLKVLNLPINFNKLASEIRKYLIKKNIVFWKKLIPLSEESIIGKEGFYYSTFKLIQLFYYLNDLLSVINKRLKSIYSNPDKWYSFQTMIYTWLSEVPKLTNRNTEIIINRLGIGNENHKTLQELGNTYNLSRERIRQIVEKAEDRLLRHPTESKRIILPA